MGFVYIYFLDLLKMDNLGLYGWGGGRLKPSETLRLQGRLGLCEVSQEPKL